MLYKELKNEKSIIQIYRQKSPIQIGYEYYLQVLTKSAFNNFVINENYKQKTEINSEKTAVRIANQILNN